MLPWVNLEGDLGNQDISVGREDGDLFKLDIVSLHDLSLVVGVNR